MKFCPECGSKLFEGKKFCPECGFKIESTQPIDKTGDVKVESHEAKSLNVDAAVPKVSLRDIIPYKKFGLKTYTFIFATIFFIHAVWITEGVPSFLWLVDLQTAANVAIGEYSVSMFIIVALVFRLVTHGTKRQVMKDGKPIVKRKIREI